MIRLTRNDGADGGSAPHGYQRGASAELDLAPAEGEHDVLDLGALLLTGSVTPIRGGSTHARKSEKEDDGSEIEQVPVSSFPRVTGLAWGRHEDGQ